MGSAVRLAGPRAWLALVAAVATMYGAPMGARAETIVASRADTSERVVALTFDDGWHPGRCEEIVDILVQTGVPATWFPNAVFVRDAPALWRRVAERFPIGNHTTHHRALRGLPLKELRHEIRSDERHLESVTGRPMSKLLRPPYGVYDRRVLREAGRLGYETVVLWDVSADDTSRRSTDRRAARLASRGRPGSIVLMHCGPAVTPRILPIVIARYACAGFRFATVEELLAGEAGVEATVACPPPKLPRRLAQAEEGPAAEGPRGPALDAELTGKEWRLMEAASGEALEPLAPDDLLTLRFAGRMASGSVGCDAYAVPVSVATDGTLSFGRLVRSTEGCGDCGSVQANDHLGLLTSTVSYRIVDGRLDLLDAKGREILRFGASDPVGIIGEWAVVALESDDGTLEAPQEVGVVTATFGATGTLRGSTGCNPYVGGYSIREDGITAGPLLVGAADCGEHGDTLEGRFIAAMRSAAGWELRDTTLELRDSGGRLLLVLAPRSPVP